MKHRIIMFVCLICLLFVGFGTLPTPVAAAGNIYYVAKTGNDSNPGTQAQPFLTIQKGVNSMVAGDTLYIRAGTYNERVTITKVGDASHWTKLCNYQSETVTIDGTGFWVPFEIRNSSYVELNGLQVRNNYGSGVMVYGKSHYINLVNLVVHDTYSEGILVEPNTSGDPYSPGDITHILIDGCVVHDICQGGIQEGISLCNVDYFEIKNCVVYRTGGTQAGIDCKVGCTNGSIHNNEVYNCGALIYLDGWGHPQSNIEVYNNLLHDSTQGVGISIGCEQAPANQTNINIYNNVIYGCRRGFMVNPGEPNPYTKNFSFVNNTLYRNAAPGLTEIALFDTGPYQNCVIANNIIYMADPYSRIVAPSTYGVINDHNLIYNTAEFYPVDDNHDYGTNAIKANPRLINPPSGFGLQAGSPAVDAGSSSYGAAFDFVGASRPQGAGYDIGAYEYQIASISPPSVTTNPTSNVTANGATLNGSLTTLGSTSPVNVSFDWGTDTSYTGGNIAGNPSSITSVLTAFSASLSGLTAGTTYHYRAKAVGAITVYGSDQQFTTLTSPAAPAITTGSLPNGTVGVAYSQTLTATGGSTPYTWTIASGTLPAGLSLSSSGVISGTPTTAGGPTSVTFRVTDSASATVSKSLSITVINAAWDVNTDGVVNVLDMISISQHWGETGTPGWIRQDVNGDGVINVLDQTVIGQHWTG